MNIYQETQDISKNYYIEYNTWILEARNEYKRLLAEQDDIYSPCSSKINSNRIWLNERYQIPLLERQEGFNINRNKNKNI